MSNAANDQRTVIDLRVTPSAKKDSVGGSHDGRLCVRVSAPPDKGRANEAVRGLLAEAFGVSKSSVELVSGETSRQKRFAIYGDSSIVQTKLGELLTQC